MPPHIPDSHLTSRQAVNRVRLLLEDAGHIVEEVSGTSDFGEDLRVTFGAKNKRTPYTVAIQVKGGRSHRRKYGYCVRVGKHGDNWAETNIPVACVVHDPDVDGLFWTNASRELHHAKLTMTGLSSLRIPGDARLDEETLPEFVGEMRGYIDGSRGIDRAVEELCGVRVGPRDYVAYAPNIHGEQMVFIQRWEAERSLLLHVDLDWQPIEITREDLLLPGTDEHRRRMPHETLRNTPLIGDIILDVNEAIWIMSCFMNSEWHSPRRDS
ncbi:protein of unknown function [Saccharopolyspora antimicrobica]|uniref:Uncharacterized protein DUF4365 n=1 Tax=Saccharopolyspora antimicrobica TaxID=455193 RepID=A0A1I5L355_9PSEU|nr:DUF4365 domain-containing protein [Saccharopolyspora antimicrobica]RKT86913.1 uncharacterized protein DUF4365 [Saccharopolyspora antimicrobica]SFO91618.1 protein of unknown function [Saccharopolyspora antimicrobica]